MLSLATSMCKISIASNASSVWIEIKALLLKSLAEIRVSIHCHLDLLQLESNILLSYLTYKLTACSLKPANLGFVTMSNAHISTVMITLVTLHVLAINGNEKIILAVNHEKIL